MAVAYFLGPPCIVDTKQNDV